MRTVEPVLHAARRSGPATPPRSAAVWLPWLAAPAFFLLPIGGCGGMALLRRPAVAAAPMLPGPAAQAAQAAQAAPVTTVVTAVPTAR